jgi:hypothetical protein
MTEIEIRQELAKAQEELIDRIVELFRRATAEAYMKGLTDSAEDLAEGEAVSVYIKSVNPEKMKLKLSVVERLGKSETPPLTYFYHGAHMDRWDYSPKNAEKKILSLF